MKKVGIIKRVSAVGLIFLLSINSFAAATGANDGSAFITKAEFDSLKNNFQSQIDSYNQNIDSKIDAAIAAYLSGIRVNKNIALTNNIAKLNDIYNVQWDNSSSGYQTTKPGYNFVFEAYVFYEIYDRNNRTIVQKNVAWNKKTIEIEEPLSMPICNKSTAGKITINNYEVRQTMWNVVGTWDYPFHSAINTSSALAFSTIGHLQVLRDVNPCKNINVVSPPQVWSSGMEWTNINSNNSSCTMVVTGSCSISTTNVDNNLILMNTNTAATTYYFNLDNEIKSQYHAHDSDRGWTTFDHDNWQAPPDARKSPNLDDNPITGTASLGGFPSMNTTDCPWSQNTDVSQNMYDSRIVSLTGKDKPIKNGICMFEVDQVGKITFDVTPEDKGSVRIYAFKQSTPSTNIIDDTINFSSATKKSYTYNINNSLKPSSTDKIEFWVIFKPDSGRKKLSVENLMLQLED